MLHTDLIKFYKISNNSHLWQSCLEYIRSNCKHDPLYKNYVELNPDQYLFFNGIIYGNRIISFGGIEHSPAKWGDSTARILTRFWIHPDFRSHNLTKWTQTKIRYSPLVLKPQLEFLKSQTNIKVAMITREGKYKNSFRYFLNLVNKSSEYQFQLLDGLYNVCEPMNQVPDSCKQMIALSPLESINLNKYISNLQENGFLKQQ
jgi:hypothetical protein